MVKPLINNLTTTFHEILTETGDPTKNWNFTGNSYFFHDRASNESKGRW